MDAATATIQIPADPHVFLIGRPPINDYLGFVTATIEGEKADKRQLVNAWRSANDHVVDLETTESGIADDVAVSELDGELQPLRDRILSDPVTQRSFPLTPIDVGLVELDRLVVYQKFINLAHIERLRTRVAAATTPEKVFRLCLPLEEDRVDPPTSFGGGPGGWVFKSPSNDLRVVGAQILSPDQVTGLDVSGVPKHVVTISVGYGPNYFAAVQVEGRLILWNGSHRAYALREAGHTHVPCLIKHVSRRDELEAMGQQDVASHTERYLGAPRPPILRDYFDDALRLVARVRPTVRQIQLGVNAPTLDLPA